MIKLKTLILEQILTEAITKDLSSRQTLKRIYDFVRNGQMQASSAAGRLGFVSTSKTLDFADDTAQGWLDETNFFGDYQMVFDNKKLLSKNKPIELDYSNIKFFIKNPDILNYILHLDYNGKEGYAEFVAKNKKALRQDGHFGEPWSAVLKSLIEDEEMSEKEAIKTLIMALIESIEGEQEVVFKNPFIYVPGMIKYIRVLNGVDVNTKDKAVQYLIGQGISFIDEDGELIVAGKDSKFIPTTPKKKVTKNTSVALVTALNNATKLNWQVVSMSPELVGYAELKSAKSIAKVTKDLEANMHIIKPLMPKGTYEVSRDDLSMSSINVYIQSGINNSIPASRRLMTIKN
jgi:hypothetical protein